MTNLQMPERIDLEESSKTKIFGRFIASPLEEGYGTTLGNSMRRILLSSIPGTAFTSLRIEGVQQTYFAGQVDTTVHQVMGHECDGLNNGDTKGYSGPGPTEVGALDDAASANGFTWSGTWDNTFQDFSIDTIAGETPDQSQAFWYQVRNWNGLDVGGCQQQVQSGDNLVIAVSRFGGPPDYKSWPLLELSGVPATAATGQSFTAHVDEHDGYGTTVAGSGASVGGATTGADGNAVVSFGSPGNYTLKATRANSIRSNAQTVCVYTPGSGGCGTQKTTTGTETTPTPTIQTPAPALKDTTPPTVDVTSLVAGKVYRRGPRLLSGDAADAGGIYQVFLRLRLSGGSGDGKAAGSRCRWFSGKRGVFTHRTVPCSRARYFRIGDETHWSYLLPARLRGGSYVLDVKVLDRSYNAGRSSVPFAVK